MSQFVTDNGTIDTIVLDYNYYEEMYVRLMELEAKEEAGGMLKSVGICGGNDINHMLQ